METVPLAMRHKFDMEKQHAESALVIDDGALRILPHLKYWREYLSQFGVHEELRPGILLYFRHGERFVDVRHYGVDGYPCCSVMAKRAKRPSPGSKRPTMMYGE
jgi:hypothetical protein